MATVAAARGDLKGGPAGGCRCVAADGLEKVKRKEKSERGQRGKTDYVKG